MKGVDEVASALLECVIERGGEWDAEPGQLIKEVAECIGASYSQTAVAIRYLERIEFLQVERQTHPEPGHHNLLIRIAIV